MNNPNNIKRYFDALIIFLFYKWIVISIGNQKSIQKFRVNFNQTGRLEVFVISIKGQDIGSQPKIENRYFAPNYLKVNENQSPQRQDN